MIPREILKKIRQIELRTNRIVTETLAGQYHSVFKGQGMNFDEVREYQPGDDVRAIDWNVTARMNHPFIKKFVEERELTLMLVVDVSGSGLFGSRDQSKRELAAEIASVLAFSAIRNNDKVGLILFSDEVEKFIPPRKGRSHVLRVIREVLYFQPQRRGTDLVNALEFMARVTSHRAIAVVISDFIRTRRDWRAAETDSNRVADVESQTRRCGGANHGSLRTRIAEAGPPGFGGRRDRRHRGAEHRQRGQPRCIRVAAGKIARRNRAAIPDSRELTRFNSARMSRIRWRWAGFLRIAKNGGCGDEPKPRPQNARSACRTTSATSNRRWKFQTAGRGCG